MEDLSLCVQFFLRETCTLYAGAQIPKHDDDDDGTLFDGYELTVDQVVKLVAVLGSAFES